MNAKVKPIKNRRPMITKRLAARIAAWDEMRAEGGDDKNKKVKNGFGKLDSFRRPGSQKK